MNERYVLPTNEPGKPERLPRPLRARRPGRAAAALVSVAALAAAVIAVVALGRAPDGRVPAVAPPGFGTAVPSSSLPPDSGGEPGIAEPDAGSPVGREPSPDALPSPAAAPSPIPVASGSLGEVPAAPSRAVPVGLIVEALDIDAPVGSVGIKEGEMDIPASADDVAWYAYGPAPGERGSAVLAAHVDWGGRAGVFHRLRDIPPDAAIEVLFDDGSARAFRAVRLTSYPKEDLPVESIFARQGGPILTLITCGGAFNPSLRSYADNVVVYAVPAESDIEQRSASDRIGSR